MNVSRMIMIIFDAEKLFDEEGDAESILDKSVVQTLEDTYPGEGISIADVAVEQIQGSFLKLNKD